jgi:hypothetical protein
MNGAATVWLTFSLSLFRDWLNMLSPPIVPPSQQPVEQSLDSSASLSVQGRNARNAIHKKIKVSSTTRVSPSETPLPSYLPYRLNYRDELSLSFWRLNPVWHTVDISVNPHVISTCTTSHCVTTCEC